MSVVAVVGIQWGDEGKGKVIDFLSKGANIVVRCQGGANARHTVVVNDEKFVLHLIPSGIIHPHTECVIGNSAVLNLEILFKEIDILMKKGISVQKRLKISDRAHVTLLRHLESDSVGTSTHRGIRPTYIDKVGRIGLHVCDLMNLQEHPYKDRLKPYVTDTIVLLHQAIDVNRHILFEGGQGIGLDIDFGTYPYVTSSRTSVGGLCAGSGIPPTKIDAVIGVAMAYNTQVIDEKPFPTLMDLSTEEKIRKSGNEFGSTTDRPRRCGWFDAVLARYAARINGLLGIVITKLDVLDNLETLQLATATSTKVIYWIHFLLVRLF